MTTVLAYASDHRAWVAADSATNVYDRPVLSAVKVQKVKTKDDHEFLLGFAGDGAGPAVLAAHLTIESLPDLEQPTDRDAWASAVARAITELYVDHGLVDGGRMDSNLVLAVPGHVWTITHHQAIRHPDGLAAVGSGEGPALGALHALLSQHVAPLRAINAACEIGIILDRYSDGPVVVEVLEDEGSPR